MRKTLTLIISVAGLLGSVWLTLRAAPHDLSVRIVTAPTDVRVRSINGATSVTVSDLSATTLTPLTDAGKPSLPMRVVSVLVPRGQSVKTVEAVASHSSPLARKVSLPAYVESVPESDATLPVAQPAAPSPVAPDDGGQAFPSELVRYMGSGLWHGYTIASFAVFPVRVEGGDIVLYDDIELRIETASAPNDNAIRALRGTAATVEGIQTELRRMVVNPDAASDYAPIVESQLAGPFAPTAVPSLEGSPVEYLIVTTNALASEFNVLATWKTAKGIPTVVKTVEWIEANYRRGTDRAETIRFFLQDAYAKWGVKWVLIGGDTQEIPARYLYSTYYYGGALVPCDMYFSCLDGNFNADGDAAFGEQPADTPDLYPEIFVGRLPVSTTGAANIVITKIKGYETPVDASYTDKVMSLAEVLFPAPWSPPATILQNGADITDYLHWSYIASPSRRVTRCYETEWLFPGSVHESRLITVDSLSAGYNQVFHVGHGFRFNMHVGDENFAIPDAEALSHPNRYFNLYMLNCTASAFDFDCLSEHLLRNPHGGAVSVLGAANSAFADISGFYMEDYVQALYTSHYVHVGETFAVARADRTPFALMGDNADLWTHYIYAILADPEMQMWTEKAKTPAVSHPSSVAAGSNAITVTVLVGGLPRQGVTVCLWKTGEDYRTALTNVAGQASFTFSTRTSGSIRVVATAPEVARYDGTINVSSASGAVLAVESMTIDDDNAGGTIGNGNGIIEAGETIDLKPSIRNSGGAGAPSVTATLSTSSGDVTLLDATAAVPAAAVGALVAASDSWRVRFAATTSDEAVANFTAVLVNNPFSWTSLFSKVVRAPALELVLLRKSDEVPVGNGNGVITNGEQFLLYATLKNYGTGSADGLSAVLRSQDGGSTVIDSVSSYAALGHLASGENSVAFRLSEANVSIVNTLKIIVTDSQSRTLNHVFELRTPVPPVIQNFDASLGVDKMQVTWGASASPDVAGYHIYRSTTASTGPFIRASSDVIQHTVFTDAGLLPSTLYYYAIAAVDASGNESALSAVASASTNPPQLTGWPNELADPSASSPVVGDIDGYGKFEIVVGNDKLYAWHHNGEEVINGDQQAITWGVFSSLGDDFVGPAALAEIDNVVGLDIAAAAYTSKQVFCFNGNGSVLPGWPRPTIDLVRAGVVVGDIDGDGAPEILAVDQEAYLYAWHANGSEVRDGDANPATDGVFKRLPDTSQWQYQMPALADIDNDGKEEVIIATQDMKVYVLNENAGNEPGWPFTLPNYAGGGVAVGDIDNNGDLEIVVTTRNTGEVYALNHDASQMWLTWINTNLFFNPSPALADITGDGKLEAIIPSSNGRLYAIMYNGAYAPGWPVYYSTHTYTESSPVIADINGDGSVDVLLGDEGKYINGWSSTGVPIDGFPLVTKDAVRGTPSVTDIDRDGDVEIVAVGYDKTVYIWSLNAPYNPAKAPWPMYKANVHHNGLHGYQVVASGTDDRPVRSWTFKLEQNYPNPFNPSTTIGYEVANGPAQRVVVTVYDVTGARVRTLVDAVVKPGHYVAKWDGRNANGDPLASGVYFCRLTTPGHALTRKMVLLK